jgi:hypothetical protein
MNCDSPPGKGIRKTGGDCAVPLTRRRWVIGSKGGVPNHLAAFAPAHECKMRKTTLTVTLTLG